MNRDPELHDDVSASPADANRRRFLKVLGSGAAMQWLASHAALECSAAERPLGAPQTGATGTGSHVGSLFPFIQSQARTDFPLSFLKDEFREVTGWKTVAREKLLELLHYRPAPCDLRAEVVEKTEHDGYTREKIYFNTTPDLRVPAYLLVPMDAKLPAPGIVALHDHGGYYLWGKEKLVESEGEHPHLREFKRGAYAGKSIAAELARRGYVVLVIDMFYWGERRMLLDEDAADWRHPDRGITNERIQAFNRRSGESEQLVGRTIYSAGFTWAGVIFWDDIRSVDYLVSRPEVDGNRIGCVGLSVGGLRSCHLAALDDRIKAAVVVGWMCSFPPQLKAHVRNTIGHTKLVPGLYRYLDYPDVASLAMPAAMLVINGSKDGLFERDGVREAFEKLTACYRKAGVPEKVATRLYEAPHEFNLQMQAEAWDWIARWL